MVNRGDVVLVDFPYASGTGSKLRPALVIQNDADNARLVNTILLQITGTTHRALEATQVLVEVATPGGVQTGLKFDSVSPPSLLFRAITSGSRSAARRAQHPSPRRVS